MGQPTPHGLYPHIILQIQYFSSLRDTWFLNFIPSNPDPLIFSGFNSNYSPCIKFWMVGSPQYWVLYFVCLRESIISMYPILIFFLIGYKG